MLNTMNTMNTTSLPSTKFLLGGLLVSLFLFSLFLPTFQAQAALGSTCNSNTTGTTGGVAHIVCDPAASCRSGSDNPNTPLIDNGKCVGPCEDNAACDVLVAAFGWGGAKCTGITGSPGVCLELPGGSQRLPSDVPETGAQLLSTVDTVTNWIFAIFVILSIIFILLAAFQFITGGGDAEKVSEARQKLIWAAVGISIALISKGLVPVIRSIIGG